MPPPIISRNAPTRIATPQSTIPATAGPFSSLAVAVATILIIRPIPATGITPQFIQPKNGKKATHIPIITRTPSTRLAVFVESFFLPCSEQALPILTVGFGKYFSQITRYSYSLRNMFMDVINLFHVWYLSRTSVYA
jgi:hypothetical protein